MQEKLKQEALNHFNEPVLLGLEVGRLIGYGEDDHDCYWIIKRQDGTIYWHTCVGGYIWLNVLKGQGVAGNWDDFIRLDNQLEYNGCSKADNFLVLVE